MSGVMYYGASLFYWASIRILNNEIRVMEHEHAWYLPHKVSVLQICNCSHHERVKKILKYSTDFITQNHLIQMSETRDHLNFRRWSFALRFVLNWRCLNWNTCHQIYVIWNEKFLVDYILVDARKSETKSAYYD